MQIPQLELGAFCLFPRRDGLERKKRDDGDGDGDGEKRCLTNYLL